MTELAAHTGKQDECPWGMAVDAKDPAWNNGGSGKTYCRTCAGYGKPGDYMERASTKSDDRHDITMDAVEKWQNRLALDNWRLFVGQVWSEEDNDKDALVYRPPAELYAIIKINPLAPADQIERLVVHEMLHLVFGPLDDLAENGQPIGIMEAYERELERTINMLAQVLTGIDWAPSGIWGERFELAGY